MITVVALVGAPLLAWGALEMWLASSGDLNAIDAKAQSAGVPSTWNQVGLTVAAPERLVIWNDLSDLAKTLKSWQTDNRANILTAWSQLPPEFTAYHAHLDPVKVERLHALLAQLGSKPLLLRAQYAGLFIYEEIPIYKRIVGLLCERLLIAPRSTLSADCDRIINFIRTMPVHNALFGMVRSSLWAVALHNMALRMDDVRALPDRDHWAATMLSFSKENIDNESGIVVGEYLTARERLSDFSVYGGGLFVGVNAISLSKKYYWRMCYRSGRSGALLDLLTFTNLVCSHAEARPLAEEYNAIKAKEKHVFRGERGTPDAMLMGSLCDLPLKAIWDNRLLDLWTKVTVAEVSRSAWPVDPFDPGHGAIRQIHQNGRLIGAHCIGLDAKGDGSSVIRYSWGLYGSVINVLTDD